MAIKIGKPVVVSDMQGPCPEGFHVPTNSEMSSLRTSLGVVAGSHTPAYFETYLKMPKNGYWRYSGTNRATSPYDRGTAMFYWCCTKSGSSAYCISGSSTSSVSTNSIEFGGNVRAFKDSYIAPDSTWTVLAGTLGSNGIFWNSTLGLISVKYNTTEITIADKNVGATEVWNSGDEKTEANCGKYFQWGNNFGFQFSGTISPRSDTQVDASAYGPTNPYSDSTFRYNSTGYWDSSNNQNLRGGVSQGTTTIDKEPKNIYVWVDVQEPPYLCFTANTAGSKVELQKVGTPNTISLETSTDGVTWTAYSSFDYITLSNIGDKVYFRNTSSTNLPFYTDGNNYYNFHVNSSGSVAASGDITSLINKDCTTTISANYCFANLFNGCSRLTSAPSLPATTLTEGCYQGMFNSCTDLTTLPNLPATTLQQYCYRYMFYYCTGIKLSTSKTGEYQTAYRIPTEGTGTTANNALTDVFGYTGGTFTGTPSINTTYYTSNTVV